MAAIIQGISILFACSGRSLSERNVRSEECLSCGLNGRGGRAEQLITNAVAAKEDTGAASTSSKPGHELLLFEGPHERLEEEMDRDPTVCVMGENVGHYGGSYKVTKGLAPKYGDLKVLDTPIAESQMVSDHLTQ